MSKSKIKARRIIVPPPDEKQIQVAVEKMEFVPFARLRIIQDDLKDLTTENYEKLKAEMLARKMSFAPHVWLDPDAEKGNGDLGILDGTQRYRVIKQMIEKEGHWIDKVPVVFVQADNEREAVLKVLGGAGMYGTPTDEGLYALMQKHGIAPIDVPNIVLPGIDVPDFFDGYFNNVPSGGVDGADVDNVPEPPANPKTRRGELWILGSHRLLCGDSTSKEDVARVMKGETAEAAITDPPYSVDYESLSRAPGLATERERGHSYEDPKDALKLLEGFISTLPADVLVMTYPVDKDFQKLAEATAGWDMLYECVWVKPTFSFIIGKRYQQQHEPILIFRRKGKKGYFDVPNDQSTIFSYNRETADKIHPTMKPVALYQKFVEYHSQKGGIVFEPFGGSGTTMMACEVMGRQCRTIEMQRQYVDATLTRWAAFTGKDPVREDGAKWSSLN